MSLRSINHNLLPVLRALLRERSVTRAAEVMGLTQPAASVALARLRSMLNDPLLVKRGRRMELSPRALLLAPKVEEICALLEQLWTNPDFNPATSERAFTFTSPDYIQVILAPSLISSLAVSAPRMILRFLDVPVDDVVRHKAVDIDFILSIRQTLDSSSVPDFEVESLFEDRIVAVVGPQHRLYHAQGVTHRDYEKDNFLVFLAGPHFLERRYEDLRNAVRAPSSSITVSQHYNSLMMIAMQTDCVALIPHHLARLAENMTSLRIIDADYSDFTIDVCLAWDRRYELDNAHRWLRDAIRRSASSLKAVSPPS